MTTVLAADENNDLFIGSDGALATRTGLDAVLQACQQAAQAQLGEMIFAVDEGIPNFATVWNGSPNKSQFEAYLRRTLLAVADVVEITALVTTIANGTLSYTVDIKTIYGTGAVNG